MIEVSNKEGLWVSLSEIVKATGSAAPTIKKHARSKQRETKTVYWLPKEGITFSKRGRTRLVNNRTETKKIIKLPILAYIKKTGIPRASVYAAIKAGWLPTVKNSEGLICILYEHKTKALREFKEHNDNFKQKEAKKKRLQDLPPLNNGSEIMLGIQTWTKRAGISVIQFRKYLKMGIFDECRLKVENRGTERFRFEIEWPGQDSAEKIVGIIKRNATISEKKYLMNELLNKLKEEVPTPELEIEEEAIAEPAIEEEAIKEEIVDELEEERVSPLLNSLVKANSGLRETLTDWMSEVIFEALQKAIVKAKKKGVL